LLLPEGLQAHVLRVQVVARELATAHGIDADQAELAAAAHDVARHLPPRRLLEEAQRLGIPVNTVEAHAPVLLHGPVGATWMRGDGSVTDPAVLEGVYWHTTAHPDLAPVGQVLFLADKLDPAKANIYPFQEEVRQAAFHDLASGMLAFLDGALRRHVNRGEMVHPLSTEVRNALILALAC
jgi:predicted HD superfamily hydrolase involved in NAD metabolism